MVKPLAETGLPAPQFISTDPTARLNEAIGTFERETGRTLRPAQPERLTINGMAYEVNLHAARVNEALKLALIDFSAYPILDYLGRFQAVERLPSASAKTTLHFSLVATRTAVTIIPAGTRVAAGDAIFATDVELLLAPGETSGTVTATAAEAGEASNGFAPGQISALLANLPGVTVTNLTPSAGGAPVEGDDALRARIMEAAEGITVAGSRGAYEARAREVSSAITAVGVHSPRPGDVDITILTRDGLPSPELLLAVADHLSDRRVRPMGDLVRVLPPRRVGFEIVAELTLTQEADAASTLDTANKAASSYAAALRAALGRDVVPNQIRAALLVPGVHDLTLNAPAARVLEADEWADCDGITLTLAGRADG
jgi:phage-related baseplate assembly protein